MNFSIIQKSQLEGAHRLDAEYYQPEYLKIAQTLSAIPHKTLEESSESLVSFGAYALTSLIEWEDEGIPFIVAENIADGFVEYEGARYISEKTDEILKKSRVKEGQVLLAMSGSVGNAAVVIDPPPKLNSNQDIVKITPNISPFVLAAFLNSTYGKMQVLRLPVGSVQQHIFLWQMKTMLIPDFTPELIIAIEKIYKSGLEEIINSKKLYSQAENLLLEELGLTNKKFDEDLATIVKFSEIKSAGRIDADYFQPKYQKILSLIRANGGIELGELATVKKGIEPGANAYQDDGRLFIRVSSLSKFGITDKDEKYLNEKLYETLKTNYQPKVGEVLLTKDASPGVAYALKENVEGIISGGILRLKMKKDMDSEYLTLCINSVVGQAQVERDAGGSIIRHWKPEQVKHMLIPILSKLTQQKIADLVRQSHEARKKSKQLLEEAKHKVEEMIKKGGMEQ